jgi:hypothetical protein
MAHLDQIDLNNLEFVGMDAMEKQAIIEAISRRLLELRVQFAEVSSTHAGLKAEISLLNAAKSALQTALRVEVRLADG